MRAGPSYACRVLDMTAPYGCTVRWHDLPRQSDAPPTTEWSYRDVPPTSWRTEPRPNTNYARRDTVAIAAVECPAKTTSQAPRCS